ncbi:MAG: ice-binding family protein [Gallionella sp.]|nr:ice-binding family protein [Gallionella sp.]
MNNYTNSFKPAAWLMAVLFAIVVSGCGGGGGAATTTAAPTSPGAGTGLNGLGKGPAPVVLGAAGTYAILAKSAITTVPASAIIGNVGLSPAAASFITGFTLIAAPSNIFSTSTQVTGQVFAADYAVPTPANLTTAVSNMLTAYTDAAGRAADFTEVGGGNIGGMTLPAGTYKWATGVTIPSNVTLNGGPNDVWIFQIAQGITQSSATQVILTGGALPKNVFWQSFGVVDIGTTAHMEGVILAQTSITLKTGASANSRLLAQTAVTLDANAVTQPAP